MPHTSNSLLLSMPTSIKSPTTSDESRSTGGDLSTEHQTAGPTPLQVAIVEHRTAIVTATVAGHFGHWHYLTRVQRINPHASVSRPSFMRAGLGWGLVYVGVLSTITLAQRSVARHSGRKHLPSTS